MNDSLQKLNRSRMLFADCEQSASTILDQLSIDRENPLRIRKNVGVVDNHVNLSTRILNKMNKINIRKRVMGVTATTVVGGVIGAIIATISAIV